MAITSSGTISIGDLQAEFGGINDHQMAEYRGLDGTPSTGAISLSDFYGKSAAKNSVATYLGTGTGGYAVTGPGIMVVAGERVSSSPGTITSATIDGGGVSYTTVYYGGNDWMYGTRTTHQVGIYGYFSVPSGSHTVAVSSSGTNCQIFIQYAGTIQATGGGISSLGVTVGTAQTIVAAASSDKGSVCAQQGNMIQDYYTNNANVAHRSGNGTSYATTVRANGSGRAGYMLFNGANEVVTT